MFEPVHSYVWNLNINVWKQPLMSETRHLCLSHTYQHTFMYGSRHSHVWDLTIYVWKQTLMSETRLIRLDHTCMYEFIVIYVWKPDTYVWRPYIYVWTRHIGVSEACCENAQISAERRGTAMEVEVAIGVHGVFPLPMGIEREDRCEWAGLWTWKGSTASETRSISSVPGWWIIRSLICPT